MDPTALTNLTSREHWALHVQEHQRTLPLCYRVMLAARNAETIHNEARRIRARAEEIRAQSRQLKARATVADGPEA